MAGGGLLVPAAFPANLYYLLPFVQMRTTGQCSYLEGDGPDGLGVMRHVALFKSHDAARGRAVYAMHIPMDKR